MKILFLVSNLSAIGGIQQYNRKFLNTLKEFKHNVRVVELKNTSLFFKIRFFFDFILKNLLFRPKIIICSHLNFSALCFIAKKILGTEYTVNLYGIDSLNIRKVRQLFLKDSKKIIIPFNWTRGNVLDQLPELHDRVFVLPNPVQSSNFFIKEKSQNLLERYNLSNTKVILTVARLNKDELGNKGYDRVIKAMPVVLKEISNAKYILVGQGDDLPRLLNLVKSLKLENNVFFIPSVKDEELNDYYNLTDVFVLPSKKEGFPAIVVLEALACGVPVVCGEQPGSEEVIWQETSLIVPPDDIKAISRAIAKILSGEAPKNLYNREFLRRRVLEIYGPERYNQHIQDFLNRISIKNS